MFTALGGAAIFFMSPLAESLCSFQNNLRSPSQSPPVRANLRQRAPSTGLLCLRNVILWIRQIICCFIPTLSENTKGLSTGYWAAILGNSWSPQQAPGWLSSSFTYTDQGNLRVPGEQVQVKVTKALSLSPAYLPHKLCVKSYLDGISNM